MAELADALDSGSSGGDFVQVQVLLPAPKKIKGMLGIPSIFLIWMYPTKNLANSKNLLVLRCVDVIFFVAMWAQNRVRKPVSRTKNPAPWCKILLF